MAETIDAMLLDLVRDRLLREYPSQVAACLDALDEEDIWWRPHERANAVGNLLLHVAGSNRRYLEHVIGGGPDVRDREAEFTAHGGWSRADLQTLWSDVSERVGNVLRSLAPERLGDVTSDRGRSVAQVLLHVTHHNALHIGQIVWVTKMRRPGALHELFRSTDTPRA